MPGGARDMSTPTLSRQARVGLASLCYSVNVQFCFNLLCLLQPNVHVNVNVQNHNHNNNQVNPNINVGWAR